MLKSTECVVCFQEYNNGSKFPLVSSCGHTLCKECSPNVQICPTCRSYSFDNQKLIKNYAVLGILEEMQITQRPTVYSESELNSYEPFTVGGLVVQVEALSPMKRPRKLPTELDKPTNLQCQSECSLM